jgi:hypothetical protein
MSDAPLLISPHKIYVPSNFDCEHYVADIANVFEDSVVCQIYNEYNCFYAPELESVSIHADMESFTSCLMSTDPDITSYQTLELSHVLDILHVHRLNVFTEFLISTVDLIRQKVNKASHITLCCNVYFTQTMKTPAIRTNAMQNVADSTDSDNDTVLTVDNSSDHCQTLTVQNKQNRVVTTNKQYNAYCRRYPKPSCKLK